VKNIDPKNLVFLDEIGVLLGLTRTHVQDMVVESMISNHLIGGNSFTVIGAISLKKVVGLMTLNGSMDSQAFAVFVEHSLVPNLWKGAVVVMDNLPAHKLSVIEPLIQAAGASILNLSPYSSDFNPIELCWSQLKAFLRQFSSTTTKIVDI
jgi:transposase